MKFLYNHNAMLSVVEASLSASYEPFNEAVEILRYFDYAQHDDLNSKALIIET